MNLEKYTAVECLDSKKFFLLYFNKCPSIYSLKYNLRRAILLIAALDVATSVFKMQLKDFFEDFKKHG